MKKLIIVLLILCTGNIFGQSEAEEMLIGEMWFAIVENYLYEYEDSSQKYIKVEPFQWSEFDYNIYTCHATPDKIAVNTFFLIPPVDAGGEHLEGTIFFKTTIQFVYGARVSGNNVLNPFTGEEIPVIVGSFTSKDIIKMFEEHQYGMTGLHFTSDDFLLKEYLLKNNVSLEERNHTGKYLGRIIIKTYIGSSKDKLNIVSETVVNPMDFYKW